MKTLYTAEALATGAGRDGHVRTRDGQLDIDLATPGAMGGSGTGLNPEQLFAAGYAACFHSALQMVARQQGVELGESSVGARVGIGALEADRFGLEVALEVVIPGLDPERAQALADIAHQVCPYSDATRGNIPVSVEVVAD